MADSYEGEQSLKELEELLQKPECVGVGEVGLDYNRNFSAKDRQKELFEKQVGRAPARLDISSVSRFSLRGH